MLRKLICLLLLVSALATASAEGFELDGLNWNASPEEIAAWLGDGAQTFEDAAFTAYVVEHGSCLGLNCARISAMYAEGGLKLLTLCLTESEAGDSADPLIALLTERFGSPDGEDALPYALFDIVQMLPGPGKEPLNDIKLCSWTTEDCISIDLYEREPSGEQDETSYRYIVGFSSDDDLLSMVGESVERLN